jgi:DNA-binding response OmpR family regulator
MAGKDARRMKGITSQSSKQDRLAVGPLIIDRHRHEVRLYDHSFHLTPTECSLLCVLASRPGKVYRREELLKLVWGTGIFVEARTVDAHMAKLRQKLRVKGDDSAIAETVWGVGYRLRIESF